MEEISYYEKVRQSDQEMMPILELSVKDFKLHFDLWCQTILLERSRACVEFQKAKLGKVGKVKQMLE